MSKPGAKGNMLVKLIVGAGQASPSPPVGPALGSKGVKSMDFCKVRPNNPRNPYASCSIRSMGQGSSMPQQIDNPSRSSTPGQRTSL